MNQYKIIGIFTEIHFTEKETDLKKNTDISTAMKYNVAGWDGGRLHGGLMPRQPPEKSHHVTDLYIRGFFVGRRGGRVWRMGRGRENGAEP